MAAALGRNVPVAPPPRPAGEAGAPRRPPHHIPIFSHPPQQAQPPTAASSMGSIISAEALQAAFSGVLGAGSGGASAAVRSFILRSSMVQN